MALSFDSIKKNWNQIAGIAIWLVGIVTAFITSPPVAQGEGLVFLVRFVVTCLVGLILIATWRWNKREHGKWWLAGMGLLLILGIASYFYYWDLVGRHVVTYFDQTLIIGDEFTEHVKDYCRDAFNMPCEDVDRNQLIIDHGGKIHRIWTQRSIDAVKLKLAVTYVLTVPIFAAAILCVSQAIYCFRNHNGK